MADALLHVARCCLRTGLARCCLRTGSELCDAVVKGHVERAGALALAHVEHSRIETMQLLFPSDT